jgi:hypothetical protein
VAQICAFVQVLPGREGTPSGTSNDQRPRTVVGIGIGNCGCDALAQVMIKCIQALRAIERQDPNPVVSLYEQRRFHGAVVSLVVILLNINNRY